jgi:DNA-binding XRE family transcriptional regulator
MYVYIEQGDRNPSLDVANRLEDLFKVPQRELLVLDSTPKELSRKNA